MKIPFRKSTTEDVVITLLRIGKQCLHDGITYSDVKTRMEESGLDYEPTLLRYLFLKMFEPLPIGYSGNDNHRTTRDIPHGLRVDGYFNLLEHDELNEARQSSRRATYFAAFAILISVVSIIISMISTDTVRLDDQQVREITKRLELAK